MFQQTAGRELFPISYLFICTPFVPFLTCYSIKIAPNMSYSQSSCTLRVWYIISFSASSGGHLLYFFASYIYFSRSDIIGSVGVRFGFVGLPWFMTGLLFFTIYHYISFLVHVHVCMRLEYKAWGRLAGSDRLTWKFWNNLLTYQILFSRWFTLFLAFWLEVVVCFFFWVANCNAMQFFFYCVCVCIQ